MVDPSGQGEQERLDRGAVGELAAEAVEGPMTGVTEAVRVDYLCHHMGDPLTIECLHAMIAVCLHTIAVACPLLTAIEEMVRTIDPRGQRQQTHRITLTPASLVCRTPEMLACRCHHRPRAL